ncbi:MAG: PhoH family protein [Bacteroidota bacterium]
MAEHIFDLSEINPLEIYGVNNLRLQQIEQGFPGIKFVARGDELKVRGEETKIEKLKLILGALFEEVRKKGKISENRFTEILEPQAEPSASTYPEIDDDTVLLHGGGGLIIKPKNSAQRRMVSAERENDVLFAVGPAGTGKTYLAVALAVKALKEKQVKKIVLSRPAVDAGESLGFLPGDMKEKIDPYLRPIYDALGDMIHTEKLKYYLSNNIIEIVPLAYMRGRTLSKAYVILDEAQNASETQLKMFLTRLGEQSKMIITGDDSQIDLPRNQRSGLIQGIKILQGIKGIAFIRFKAVDVVRHKLVRSILAAYEKIADHKGRK